MAQVMMAKREENIPVLSGRLVDYPPVTGIRKSLDNPDTLVSRTVLQSFGTQVFPITEQIVFTIGASVLNRTLDSIPYKTRKKFVRRSFSVPRLIFND